jgi:predicted ATPase
VILTAIAKGFGGIGKFAEGLQIVDDALAQAEPKSQYLMKAELHRVRGELLLGGASPNHTEALSCFQQSVEVAQEQGAKSWELRTTISQARLLAKQNRHDQARAVLTEIYGWFTEGFDTADLKDAKALLDELSA